MDGQYECVTYGGQAYPDGWYVCAKGDYWGHYFKRFCISSWIHSPSGTG